jgi:F-type H+-transporting ATPase subunit a
MGEEQAKKYYTVIVLLFSFIFINNVIGLIPGFLPPTDNFNTTLALGLFVFLYYNYQGIKEQGIVGHIKHFMGPVWYLAILIFPIELISHAVRPLSLGLRLKGNMEGDHLVLSIFSNLVPYIVPIPFYVIGLFVCFMQAFVFTLLTMVYISLATAHHDHEEHAHH